jgi:hypothetical protein
MEYASKGDFSQVFLKENCRLLKKEEENKNFIQKMSFGNYLNK